MTNFLAQPPQQETSAKTLAPFPPLLSEYYVPQVMPNVLGHSDMFFMYVLALFLMTNAVISASGGAVSILYLIIGAIIFFLPCIFIAAQLAVLGFLCYCVGAAIFYTMVSSRIVMVAAIDQRIPTWFGRLNRARVPQNAILFQSVFTAFVILIVFVVAPPVSPIGGGAANALVIIYNVISASTTLVWTFATAFFFINIVLIYLRHRQRFQKSRVLPLAVIWVCAGIGGIACLLTIVGILAFSWIPTLISNGQWWLPVSGLVVSVVAITSIGSVFANSAATWEVDVQEFAPASYPSIR